MVNIIKVIGHDEDLSVKTVEIRKDKDARI